MKWRALLLVVTSAVVGLIYYGYLNAEPYPSRFMRLVPFAWLGGTIVGCVDAARAMGSAGNRTVAGMALFLAIPSGLLASIFTMAALMGD